MFSSVQMWFLPRSEATLTKLPGCMWDFLPCLCRFPTSRFPSHYMWTELITYYIHEKIYVFNGFSLQSLKATLTPTKWNKKTQFTGVYAILSWAKKRCQKQHRQQQDMDLLRFLFQLWSEQKQAKFWLTFQESLSPVECVQPLLPE